jgi:hypothetical protein
MKNVGILKGTQPDSAPIRLTGCLPRVVLARAPQGFQLQYPLRSFSSLAHTHDVTMFGAERHPYANFAGMLHHCLRNHFIDAKQNVVLHTLTQA